MPAVDRVLVVGAGAAGAATAILLAERGVSVDLVDSRDDVSGHGSGITLQGNALRVLRSLGIWEELRAAGYEFDTLGLRAPDPAGTLIVELTEMRTGGPDLPATLGMNRPALARILLDRAVAVGVKVRFGTTYTLLEQDDSGAVVGFADGSSDRYDLVVGADGIRSTTRRHLGIDAEPTPTGMGIWRIFGPRPDSVVRTDLVYGGPCHIAGYCPTAEDTLYAYLVEDVQDRSGLDPQQALQVVRGLAAGYHGPWDDIRDGLVDPDQVNYTRFETHLVDGPWHRGRVVVIGDAAHSCPPTMAQGAAMALEDAAVLAELLLERDAVDDDLWAAFTARRLERVRTVVDASVQIGRWQLAHEQGDVAGLMASVSTLLATPPDPDPRPRKEPTVPERLITHLRHVDLAVPDYDKQLEFYTSTWGLSAETTDDGIAFLAAEGSPEQYSVRLRRAEEKRLDLISFGAASEADVDALAARLGSEGVRLVGEPDKLQTPGGGYGFRFFDVDGRTVEVSSDVEVRRHRKVEEGESIPVKLSHVVVNSPNPEATVAFYDRYLGFALSDTLMHPRMGEMMWFLRTNAIHHSLAIARGPHVALHHASFELRGIDEYMRGTGRVLRSGTEKIWGPGRHMAGNNTFSYFLDPHGNTIEYTTELEQLDEDTWHPHLYDFSDPEVSDQWGTANPMNELIAKQSFNDVDRGVFVAPPV